MFNHKVGKYEMPHPHREYDQSEHAFVVTSVERYTTEYELSYNEKNIKELLQFCSDDTGYSLINDNITHTISRKEFCESDFDQIVNSRRKQ